MGMQSIDSKPTAHCDAPEKECILCGRCLEVCPLFRATQREELSPKAKQFLGQTVGDAEKKAQAGIAALSTKELVSLCLSCGRCEQACPQELCAPDLAGRMRAAHPDWRSWFWRTWIERGGLIWPVAAALGKFIPENAPGKRLKHAARSLKTLAGGDEPAPWLKVTKYSPKLDDAPPKKAALFAGCLGERARKSWIRKTHAMLEGQRYEVVNADWTCCGCTLGHAGVKDVQLKMQQHNVQAWRDAGRPMIPVFCATCRCGLNSYAGVPEIDWAPGEGEQWQSAIKPLASMWGAAQFEILDHAPERVLFHRPCHGGGKGGNLGADLGWLTNVLGQRLAGTSKDECCGMGGVMQLGAPELSTQVAQWYWERLGAKPGDVLLTACSGCVLQLSATAPKGVSVGHWLDIIC